MLALVSSERLKVRGAGRNMAASAGRQSHVLSWRPKNPMLVEGLGSKGGGIATESPKKGAKRVLFAKGRFFGGP